MGIRQPVLRAKPFYPAQWGIDGSDNPLGLRSVPEGMVYYVNSEHPAATDSNWGTDPGFPMSTVLAAYNRCTAGQNDVVMVIGQATGYPQAATLTWAKDYTHLIGIDAGQPGVGQRVRLTGSATADLTHIIDVQADGCLISNIQFANFADANVDSGAAIVSGDRNVFENCFFAGMGHATPAARAGSYSLKLTGEENSFFQCAIGLDTILRGAANAELWVTTGAARCLFKDCRFLSYSETAAKVLVLIDDLDRWIEFDNCIFQNFSVNWANMLTNAFSITAGATHQVIHRGLNQLVGVTGWADTVTHVYSAAPVSNAGYGVQVNPTT